MRQAVNFLLCHFSPIISLFDMAVRSCTISLVKAALGFPKGPLVHDAYGVTPPHYTVQLGHPFITQD